MTTGAGCAEGGRTRPTYPDTVDRGRRCATRIDAFVTRSIYSGLRGYRSDPNFFAGLGREIKGCALEAPARLAVAGQRDFARSPRIFQDAGRAGVGAQLDEIDPARVKGRVHDECARGEQGEVGVPIARPGGKDFQHRIVGEGGVVAQQRRMERVGQSAEMFGVDRAGPFAEAEAVAENFRGSRAGALVDETAEAVDAEEPALEV